MNQKIKSILFVSLVVLGISALASVTLADQITGTLTTGTNSSNATGTLTTGLSNGVSGIVMVLPTANPVAGTYTSAQSVILTASGASSINYTLDGIPPTCFTGNVYSGPISVGSSETIQAVSCYPDNNTSAIASFAYVINTPVVPPVASPAAGIYTSAQTVVLTASGASSINYTTDGTIPTCSTGTVYSDPISVGSSETIQAVSCYTIAESCSLTSTSSSGENGGGGSLYGCGGGGAQSPVASFAYVINIPSSSGGTVVSSGGGGGYIAPISTPTITTTTTSSIPTVGQVLGASTMNTAALLQELQNLEQQLVTIEFKVNKCSFTFNTNLSKGMTSSEVQSLQKVLNYTSLTQVAISGPGSPNNESTYFGSATKNAVIAFQNIFADQILTPNGLTSGNGYVGSATRSVLNSLCSQ